MSYNVPLKLLNRSIEDWNAWRSENSAIQLDLKGINFRDRDLAGIDLRMADLRSADLSDANLFRADFTAADLAEAKFCRANLNAAEFCHADLRGANFGEADLNWTNFYSADLDGASFIWAKLRLTLFTATNLGTADFNEATFAGTVMMDVDLSNAKGLENCRYWGPSIVDHRSLQRSKNVPITFWRGCGLPNRLIEYMPSIFEDAIQFYSCFISYSSEDQDFADRLNADLQNAGVRCWFAPHDLPIGAKTWDGIDQAIRTRDKVLLILSKGAIGSDWVEDEVTTAFAEERRRKELVLFPVRLDGAVMESNEPWAGKLRDNRNIGDFTEWKDHDAYKRTFERVLRDLKADR